MAGIESIAGATYPSPIGSRRPGSGTTPSATEQSPEDQAKLRRLRTRDLQLRLAHVDPASLRYEIGPDGKKYASEVVDQQQAQKAEEARKAEEAKKAEQQQEEKSEVSEAEPAAEPQAKPIPVGRAPTATAASVVGGQQHGPGIPDVAYHALTPAALLRQAQVEAAYLAQAATPPRINIRA